MTQAPSIKEALEDLISLCERKLYPQPDKPNSDWMRVQAAKAALATLQPSGERREAIARILEPQAWAALGIGDTLAYKNRRTSSLRKADQILASGLVHDEAGIRRDEREKCAKICDALGDEIMERAEEAHENEEYDEYESLECAATEYSRAASAIRSARDGGEV
jgi:hypothetical protein